ncbi:unnamed protein product [Debaryomyces fabryi]|nr:unnamed protein product [Debaryomyces fabryi]
MLKENLEPNKRNGGDKIERTTFPDDNTWLFLEDSFIKHSPSRKQLTVTQELKTRESLHDFVIRLGSALKLDSRTILAATVYINRFYMRMPITTSKYYVACAAIAISCKLNDNYRPPDKIAMAACMIKNPHKKIDEQSDVFWSWRDQLLYREELILKHLNFDLNLFLPYSIRDDLMKMLCQDTNATEQNTKVAEILKNTVSLIEVLSSLPILVAYDINTIFASALIVVMFEAKGRFETANNNEQFSIKSVLLFLHVDLNLCFKCYQYSLNLLKFCNCEDPKLISHKNASRKLLHIDQKTFFDLANS